MKRVMTSVLFAVVVLSGMAIFAARQADARPWVYYRAPYVAAYPYPVYRPVVVAPRVLYRPVVPVAPIAPVVPVAPYGVYRYPVGGFAPYPYPVYPY